MVGALAMRDLLTATYKAIVLCMLWATLEADEGDLVYNIHMGNERNGGTQFFSGIWHIAVAKKHQVKRS